MYFFFKKGIGDRVSYTSKNFIKSSNKYLELYDPKQGSKHIIYLDANKLYGYVISKFLPTSGSKCIDPKDFDLINYISNSSKGCVLKVDLEYPKELRELHNDFPLAPAKIKIKEKCWVIIK